MCARRMNRYKLTQGLNSIVQGQQFNDAAYVYPVGHRQPDQVYDDTLSLEIGGERIELFHGRGETDDATFVWLPDRRILASGDFVIWMFPERGQSAEGAALRGGMGRGLAADATLAAGDPHPRPRPRHLRRGPCRAGAGDGAAAAGEPGPARRWR